MDTKQRREFMLRMVDKYDIYFQDKGLEKRIEEAEDMDTLMELAREMDDILMADPGYRANNRAVCNHIDNPWVKPRQRINYPKDYFTRGRSSRSLAKYGVRPGYKGRRY